MEYLVVGALNLNPCIAYHACDFDVSKPLNCACLQVHFSALGLEVNKTKQLPSDILHIYV
jgi:hypothetical protein